MRPLDLTRSGLLGTLAVFIVVIVCVRLGFWQLDRRDQRLDRNEAMAERMSAEPVALDGLFRDTAGLTYRRASVVGEPDHDRSVVLAGRSHAGSPGVHVLVPLRVPGGAMLVNRGWLPAADAATVDLEPLALAGVVRVEGVLLPFPDVDVEMPPGFQRRWFRFDGDAVRGQYPYPVAPLYLQATSRLTGPGAPDPVPAFPVILAPPELDPGPHLSYALQWFSFATIFLVGWAAVVLRGRAERIGSVDRA